MLALWRRYILAGLTVLLPVLLTVYLIMMTFNFVDGFLGKFIKPLFIKFFGFYFQGSSIVVFIFLIFIIGFFASNFLGKRLYPKLEELLLKLPFFRQVYPAVKEVALFLFSRDKPAFKQVVLIEYPRKGVYSLGFLMSDASKKINDITKQELCNILIPSSPSPLTGFVVMVPRTEVIFTDITVEQAIKFIVSDGVINPNQMVSNVSRD